jgi:hypothetical protein
LLVFTLLAVVKSLSCAYIIHNDAMTFGMTTFSFKTLGLKMNNKRHTLQNDTWIMTFIKMTLTIMTLIVTTMSITTLSNMSFIRMLSIKTISIMTFIIMTLSIMTLSITTTTLSITTITLSITIHYIKLSFCCPQCLLLSVTIKLITLNVIMYRDECSGPP